MDELMVAVMEYIKTKWPKVHVLMELTPLYDDFALYLVLYDEVIRVRGSDDLTKIQYGLADYLENNWHQICQKTLSNYHTNDHFPHIFRHFLSPTPHHIDIGPFVIFSHHYSLFSYSLEKLLAKTFAMRHVIAVLPQPIAEELAEYL